MNLQILHIDVYFQFLPLWSQKILGEKLKHTIIDFFNNNIKENNIIIYTYPSFISVAIDNINFLLNNNDINYKRIILKNKFPIFKDENAKIQFIESIKKNYDETAGFEIIQTENNEYVIQKFYDNLKDIVYDIIQNFLSKKIQYKTNINWSPIGEYILPRPCEGYNFRINNEPPRLVISSNLFQFDKYYHLDFNKISTPQEKINELKKKIIKLEKQYNILFNITEEDIEEMALIHHNGEAVIGNFKEEYTQLPEDIIASTLKEHNKSFITNSIGETYFLFFIELKAKEDLPNIIKQYEDVVNIRLNESLIYFQQDKKYGLEELKNMLNKIMFFEEEKDNKIIKISMENKRQTILNLLQYFNINFNLQLLPVILEEISYFLLDINTKIVQEFNNLQGYMSYCLLKDNINIISSTTILNFYKKNFQDKNAAILQLCNNLYEVIVTIGLGGIVTPTKDPYNLKNPCDVLINILKDLKITINLDDIIKIITQSNTNCIYIKNASIFIKNRLLNYIQNTKQENLIAKDKFNIFQEKINKNNEIGWNIIEEYEYFLLINNNNQWQNIKKRLQGFNKKPNNNNNNELMVNDITNEDKILENIIENINQKNSYITIHEYLNINLNFIENYINTNKIQNNEYRIKLIKILLNNFLL